MAERVVGGGEGDELSNGFDFSSLKDLRALTSKDPSRFIRLVSLFLTSLKETFLSIQKALDQDDYSSLREVAHTLKGTSANMGALRLSSLCAALEQSCERLQIDRLETDVQNIQSEAARVKAILEAETDTVR